MLLAAIPSPAQGVWHLGPFPVRAYALCIIAGVVVAVWLGERRWQARGGRAGLIVDLAAIAVPFGLVGGRLYHVVTTPEPYFGRDGHLIDIVKIWHGGLGIWGAIVLGGVGVWIALRRRGIAFANVADACAPGIAIAQAIGRWGNWFNQELYGRHTDLPWALHITRVDDGQIPGYYHPTFLYESLWDLGIAGAVIVLDRRLRLGRGNAFALYVVLYTVGRSWIEYLRIDTAEHIAGLRLNDWTSLLVGLAAVLWILTHRGARDADVDPGRTGGQTPGADAPAVVDITGESTGSESSGPESSGPAAGPGPSSRPGPESVDLTALERPGAPGRADMQRTSHAAPGALAQWHRKFDHQSTHQRRRHHSS